MTEDSLPLQELNDVRGTFARPAVIALEGTKDGLVTAVLRRYTTAADNLRRSFAAILLDPVGKALLSFRVSHHTVPSPVAHQRGQRFIARLRP